MAAPSFKDAVDRANQLLASSGTSWRLEVRGQRLGLRDELVAHHHLVGSPVNADFGLWVHLLQRAGHGFFAMATGHAGDGECVNRGV